MHVHVAAATVAIYNYHIRTVGAYLCFNYIHVHIEPTVQKVKSTTNYSPTQISESNDDQQKGITLVSHYLFIYLFIYSYIDYQGFSGDITSFKRWQLSNYQMV